MPNGNVPLAPLPPIAPRLVANALTNPATLLFARLMLVLPYWVAGLNRLVDFQGAMAATARMGLHPAWAFTTLAIMIEIGASLLVMSDRWAWLGAGALAVFTVLAALLAHRFWDGDRPHGGEELAGFLQQVALAAAFILAGAASMQQPRDDRR